MWALEWPITRRWDELVCAVAGGWRSGFNLQFLDSFGI